MGKDALDTLLQGYTQRTWPSLALRTSIASGRVCFSIEYDAAVSPSDIAAAIVRLVAAYADTTDILLADYRCTDKAARASGSASSSSSSASPHWSRLHVDLNATRRKAIEAVQHALRSESQQWPAEHVVEVARAKGFTLKPDQSPALISIGNAGVLPRDWYPKTGVAVLTDSDAMQLSVVGDAAILSDEMASVLGRQIISLAKLWNNNHTGSFADMSLPDKDLMSVFDEPYDADEAHLPIDWLTQNARTRPDAIAHELCDEPDDDVIRSLTYGQLNQQSNRMANWLMNELHIEHGAPIGLCRKRDEHFYVGMAAIFKAGACYLPIDRDLPEERKQYILQDSKAKVLLTDGDHVGVQGDHRGFNLDVAEVQDAVARQSSKAPDVHVQLDDLAYILYTSGTSGKPKGCLLMHRGLYWAIRTFVEVPLAITDPDNDKRLAMAAVAFDVHVSEMVQCWAMGLRLVSVASRMSLLADLQATIERFGITHVGMVPSMIEATLTKKPSELPIKYITSGGEKVSDAVLATWAADPDIVFANMYGPTEATIGCTTRIVRGVDEPKEDIGYAFKGSGAYIVDGDMNLVPKGIAGELVIEGPLVARGYLNLPEATAKSFREWPRKGCRAYRTGDLVRMNFDGGLSIHGRIDSQIKLRGVRIESEGVSAVVRQAADDASTISLDAVSVICKHEAVGNADMLVTFITPMNSSKEDDDKATPTANDRRGTPVVLDRDDCSSIMPKLREACAKELASYMRPSHIVPLSFFPLSHNGKIDTKPLIVLFAETPMQRLMAVQGLSNDSVGEKGDEEDDRAPTKTEQLLIELVADLVNILPSSVSVHKSLLESGLSSLNCAKLTSLIRNRVAGGRCQVTVAQVLACESLAECARLIDERQGGKVETQQAKHEFDLSEYEETHRSAVLDVMPAQAFSALLPPLPVQPGVLFQVLHNDTGYVQHFCYRLAETFSAQQLESAWKEVQRRLDVLRVSFALDKEHLVQILLQPEHSALLFDTHHLQRDGDLVALFGDKSMLDAVSKKVNEDLAAPMFAVTAIVKDQAATAMIVSLSHTIYDAFAVRSIMTTLDSVLGSANCKGKEAVPLPQQPSLKSIVQQIRSAASDEEHAQFWRRSLECALREREKVRKQLHGDDEAAASLRPTRGEGAQRRNSVLDDVALGDVQQACRRLGVTLQTFFNVVFAVSVRALFAAAGQPFGRESVVFGNVRGGRNLPLDGIEHAAAPLVTVVPCVVGLATQDVRQLMRSAHLALVASTEHENVALSDIQAWVKQRNIVEALFSCRLERSVDRTGAYKCFQHVVTSAAEPEFALAVEVLLDETADSIDVRVAHSQSVFSSDLIDDLMRRMHNNVRAFIYDGKADGGDDTSVRNTRTRDKTSQPKAEPAQLQQIQEAIALFLQQDVDVIQPKTSLVSLGMTSLRAVALCRTLSKKHGIDLDPVDVVQGDTALSMAVALARQGKAASASSAASTAAAEWKISADEQEELGDVRLSIDDEIEVAPCTPLQAGMLSQTVATEGKLYVHAFAMKLHAGNINGAARQTTPPPLLKRLQRAWSAVHRTYAILRCSFHFVAKTGTWLQVQHSASTCPLVIHRIDTSDDGGRGGGEEEDDRVDALRRAAIQGLQLTTEQALERPPVRLVLSSDGGTLVLALHHAMYDGVSLSNLFGIVAKAFQQQEAELPAPSTSFLDLSKQLIATEEQATKYWLKRLDGIEHNVFVKPTASSSATKDGSTQAWRDGLEFTREETKEALRFCRRYRCSMQSVGQVAFAMTLYRQSQLTDVVFCQVVSGRAHRLAGDVMGPVFNTVGIRVSLAGDQSGMTAKEAVQRAQEHNGQALLWQHAALRKVQQALHRTSLSDALFLFQPALEDDGDTDRKHSPPWTLLTPTSEEGSTQFSLNFELHEAVRGKDGRGEAVTAVRASASAAVLTRSDLKQLIETFKSELLGIIRAPNKSLAASGSKKVRKSNDEQLDGVNGHSNRDGDKKATGPMIEVLREVLRLQDSVKLTQQTSLSSIGLDSIAAMQVASRARKQGINATLSPMRILRCSTLADLLATSGGERAAGVHQDQSNGDLRQRSAPVPDSDAVTRAKTNLDVSIRDHVRAYVPSAGMRYLFAGWQRSGGRQFQICIGRKLARRVDAQAMQRSWSDVVARHAILRSTIVPAMQSEDRDAELVLFVVEQEHWQGLFSVIDQRDQGSEDDDAVRASTLGRQLLRRPASMTAPSSRVTLLRLGSADYVFVQLPHTHYDAFTVPYVLDELWQGYAASSEQKGRLIPMNHEGDDTEVEAYLAASHIDEDGEADEKQASDYWQSLLGHAHQPHIWSEPEDDDKDNSNAATNTVTYYVREKRKGTPTVRALQQAANRLRTTPAALLTATWAHIHATRKRARSDDHSSSTFAFVHTGRTGEQAGLEDVHVPTINLVPTKIHISNTSSHDRSGQDDEWLLRSVKQIAQEIQQQWQQQPPWAVRSAMADVCRWVSKDDAATALCNTTLNIQIRPAQQHGKGASLRDTTATKQPTQQRWSPVALRGQPYGPHNDRGWTPAELKSFDVPTLFLQDNGALYDSTVRIDARIVVAASSLSDEDVADGAESVVVLEAEVAREIFARQHVDDALKQWAELLTKIVDDVRS